MIFPHSTGHARSPDGCLLRADVEEGRWVARDPVLAMTAFFTDAKLKRRKLELASQLSVIIRAFNTRFAGRSMKVVRIASTSGGIIPIPEVAS